MEGPLADALKEWELAIGSPHVLTEFALLGPYLQNVSALHRHIDAVLQPANSEEVQRIVEIANRYRVPLHPVSGGKNWGLGSRLPVRSGCVILDLKRLDRIHEINVDYRYAVIEPGVTQRQLYDYLRSRELPLVLNVIGSGLETSVLANALERGAGYFAARADQLSAMEVVLGNGRRIETGFAHFPNAQTKYIYKHGVGPALDGLFAQSNYGIVTRAAVELLPKPAAHCALLARLRVGCAVRDLIDGLAELRKDDVIRTVVHIGNAGRARSSLASLLEEHLAAGGSDVERFGGQLDLIVQEECASAWSVIGGILGTSAGVRRAKKLISARLNRVARVRFVDDRKFEAGKWLANRFSFVPFFRRKAVFLRAVEPLYELTKGVPSDAGLRSVGWGVRSGTSNSGGAGAVGLARDPDQSSTGLLYVLPLLPADGAQVEAEMAEISRLIRRHGFEPQITLNLMDERVIEAVIGLVFDKRDSAQTRTAHVCVDQIYAHLGREGLWPYRVGVQSMHQIVRPEDPFWQTIRDLKSALDPNNILAPGRYNLA